MKIIHFIKYITLGTALTVCTSYMPPDGKDKNSVLLYVLAEGLTAGHYEARNIDDNLSKKVYQLYLKNLDNNKQFLTQEDLAKLQPFATKIDDEIKEGRYDFFTTSYDIINQKVKTVAGFYKELLAQPFDFTQDEKFERDDEKLSFAANDATLKEQWRLRLKYSTLAMLVSNLESEEKKAKDSAGYKPKKQDVLEAEARKKVEKSYTEWFDNLNKLERADRWSVYINAITGGYDPHTTYYSPSNKQNFDIEMTGQFEGIGATLQEREGNIRVADILPGSASWRQGQLKAGDFIIKVAQDGKDAVDVTNMRLDKVVQQIRGKRGTKVILTTKKADGSIVEIPIVRDVVILEEKYAKSAVIEAQQNKNKVGYINLPGFYADFNNKGSRSCAEDVKKELVKLQAENINSVVLDLRNNGGGSLRDVIDMMGLFIDKGPVVQVKSRDGQPLVYDDTDPRLIYDGNLVILVNSFSASASEILAAAVQDYKRGIVMGSPATFGKGTVQKILDLDNFLPSEYQEVKPLGNLTLTMQKFYRVNGGATQLKGVVPDVIMNDVYSFLPLGEKDQDNPMVWDEIRSLPVKQWLSGDQVSLLVEKSNKRIKKSEVFKRINESAERAKKMREESLISLKLSSYRAELKEDREENKRMEEAQKDTPEVNVFALKTDETANNSTPENKEKADRFYKNLKKDVYLQEAMNVLADMQNDKMIVNVNKK